MFYNADAATFPVKTYGDMIALLESNPNRVSVPTFYSTGTHEWLPVDRVEYLRQLKMISKPETVPFPCLIEVEPDGEIFFHPRAENKLT